MDAMSLINLPTTVLLIISYNTDSFQISLIKDRGRNEHGYDNVLFLVVVNEPALSTGVHVRGRG